MRKTLIVTLVALAAGCSNATTSTASAPPCNPKQGPNGSPVVCIDYQTFDQSAYQPDPDPIKANHSIHVEFRFFNYTDTDDPDMDLQFPPDTQIQHLSCNRNHCSLDIKANATHQQRKYSIIDRSTNRHKDPDIIIEP